MRYTIVRIAVVLLSVVATQAQSAWFGGPFKVGTTPLSVLPEVSGMVASTLNPGILWLHNDSGDRPTLYAMTEKGDIRTQFTLGGASAIDWEDIAYGPGPVPGKTYLYAADIGDNQAKRKTVVVYRAEEPHLLETTQPRSLALNNVVSDAFTFRYPDGPRDAEALIIDPLTQDMYIISKRDKNSRVYRAAAPHKPGTTRTLEFVTTLPMQLATGADISADGKNVILKNYLYVWHWTRNGKESLSALFRRPGTQVTYMPEIQGEAICFTSTNDGYYTTSEQEEGGGASPIFYYPRVANAAEASASRDARLPQISVGPSLDTKGIYNLRYVMPDVSRVDVFVCNAIMQKVVDVATESGESGIQEREVDLIDLPFGNYVVVIKTNAHTVMIPIDHR